MIYIGTVTKIDGYQVVVDIPHYNITPTCAVVQPSVTAKQVYSYPSVGDQVVVVVTDEVKVVLGAIYSDVDPLPDKASGDNIVMQMGAGKLALGNDAGDLQGLLLDIAKLLKELKVSTAMGPSGTILPDIVLKVNDYENKVKQLIDGIK